MSRRNSSPRHRRSDDSSGQASESNNSVCQSKETYDSESLPAESEGTVPESTLIKSLQQEFRSSIDELKAAQNAAAESQSAVLRTMTEILLTSSVDRNNGCGNLEGRLSELEDRILSRISQVQGREKSDPSPARNANGGTVSSSSKSLEQGGSKSWAEIRRDLVSKVESPEESSEDVSDKSAMLSASLNSDLDQVEPDAIIDVPRAIDPETLDLPELRAVFYERESFISTLIGRLRQVHQKGNVLLPVEDLRNMAELLPEELSAEVKRALEQLDEISRIGELELSLERARLARQVNQLDNTRQLIEQNARQLGLQLADDGTLVNPEKLIVRNRGSRRWLSKLGFGV